MGMITHFLRFQWEGTGGSEPSCVDIRIGQVLIHKTARIVNDIK